MFASLWSSDAAMTAGRFLGRVVSLSSVEFLRGAAGSSNMSLELLLVGLTGKTVEFVSSSPPFWSMNVGAEARETQDQTNS